MFSACKSPGNEKQRDRPQPELLPAGVLEEREAEPTMPECGRANREPCDILRLAVSSRDPRPGRRRSLMRRAWRRSFGSTFGAALLSGSFWEAPSTGMSDRGAELRSKAVGCHAWTSATAAFRAGRPAAGPAVIQGPLAQSDPDRQLAQRCGRSIRQCRRSHMGICLVRDPCGVARG